MENITIPQEEFNAKALLADISQQIAQGRAELMQLHEQKNTFFHERELELMQRLQLILDNSVDTLKQIDKNHDTLEAFSQELNIFAKELAGWREKLIEDQKAFIINSSRFYDEFDKKMADLEKSKKDIAMQTEAIERTRKAHDRRNLELNARETAINDKYRQLMATTKRLKK